MVGYALSLLLNSVGYDTKVLDSPPTGMSEDLLEGVDLLLISPHLAKGRRQESLAVLKGTRDKVGVPVLGLSSASSGGMLDDGVELVPWPINIDALAREIEGALATAVMEIQDDIGGVVGEVSAAGESTAI